VSGTLPLLDVLSGEGEGVLLGFCTVGCTARMGFFWSIAFGALT